MQCFLQRLSQCPGIHRCIATLWFLTVQLVGVTLGVRSAASAPSVALVTNQDANSVSLIDTLTNTALGTPLVVGKSPRSIAITPDGSRAYVTEETSPRIDIQPVQALVDEPVSIKLLGFGVAQPLTLRAHARIADGSVWQSSATFLTDAHGEVDVGTQRPLSGTYTEADAMGLFWSMVLQTQGELPPLPTLSPVPPPMRVQFEAEVAGTSVAQAEVERRFMGPEVTRTEIRHQGLVATLFRPLGAGAHPAVITLGGSEGGLREGLAALLASHGFVTLALAYFGVEPLPAGLVEIPLEYFGAAIHWLQQQAGVNPQAIAVMGGSRGGELALLLGATFPEVRAVVAYVPSGVLWNGVQPPGSQRPEPVASWTLAGKPLSFMDSFVEGAIDWSHPMVERATIPVERTRGPILLISGTDDQMWPSTQLAEIVVRRLQQHSSAFPVQHLQYTGAGHLISPPYLPTTTRHAVHPVTGTDFSFGGTSAADAFACADSWPRVLTFLRKSLMQ